MSEFGSTESLYKSAPSSSSEEFYDDKMDTKIRERPNFLSGTSVSSLLQDEMSNLSTMENIKFKLNSNLAKVINFNFRNNFGSNSKVSGDSQDLNQDLPESRIKAKILGFEILEKEKRLTIYKLKVVQPCGHWGVDQIPNWFLYRRYNDFAQLHQKLTTNFPQVTVTIPAKRWIGDNFDPIFIGHRIQGLNHFMHKVLNSGEIDIRESRIIRDFLCLDSPPNRASSLSSCRALYDCFEETIRELRLQMRRKESLEELTEGLREALAQRDFELEGLRNETDQLRKQREALIKAFDGGHHDFNTGMKTLHASSGPPSDISQSSLGYSSHPHHQSVLIENDEEDEESI